MDRTVTNKRGAIKKACDQCNRRRVKCDGQQPCRTCRKGDVECTFNNPVRKKGPTPNLARRQRTRLQSSTSESLQADASPSQPETSTLATSRNDLVSQASSDIIVTAPFDLLNAMPCDDSRWDELLAQVISSRPSSPFRLTDVDPFSNMAGSGMVDGGLRVPVWAGVGSVGGMPTLSGLNNSFASIPALPSALTPVSSDPSPMFTLCLDTIVRPQIAVFFSRIAPMIPVFSAAYIQSKLDSIHHSRDFIGMVLAMTALSLVHPLNVHEALQRPTRIRQAQILMDEALRLRDGWQFGTTATVEAIMTSYLMFGTLYEMGHAAGAKLRLREAVSLGETLRLDDPRSYHGLDRAEALRRLKTYWVLSVTERAYSLQHGGGIVFEGSISTTQILPLIDATGITDNETSSPSLRYLAQLFSFIDQDIVTCWNGRCNGPSCRSLTERRAVEILRNLGGEPTEVFGPDFDIHLRTSMSESQRADLLITWQWLRNRVWRLAFLHGLTTEDGAIELSRVYLANVAIATLDICKVLSTVSMDAHGAGFMQKLYDIASAVPELLRHDYTCEPRMFTPEETTHLGKIVQADAISWASLTVVQE
ncbi:hypothetical protein NCC49_004577 [Naganishia albida]|nr:hypothetical protein NCC49_004577 [Naganishia albida]